MADFRSVQPAEFGRNTFECIDKQWMLISAKKEDRVNGMTASWGGLGIIWNRPAAFIFVRKTRFTKEFLDASDTFSLTFFEHEKYRDMLAYMGSVSGRDEDKIAHTGLTVAYCGETPYYEEAEAVMVCRKLCREYIAPEGFIDASIDAKNYPKKDYHYMYIGGITDILVR